MKTDLLISIIRERQARCIALGMFFVMIRYCEILCKAEYPVNTK